MILLSHFQMIGLLEARKQNKQAAAVSPDLGLTTVTVQCSPEGVDFASGESLSWQDIESIHEQQNNCFLLEEGAIRKIHFYSEETDRAYSLYPTLGAPTMLVSGIPMHRIKDTDPHRDTLEKIKTLQPLVGCVLDTATGLGYTAVEAARTADHVITIELDPVALEVARCNPWSQELFNNPKIEQRIGDSFDVIETLPDGAFSIVIHDPPVFSLAGHLYSLDFYSQLFRVLRSGGRIFHYIGDPESKSGRSTTAGVLRRMEQAGFRQLQRAPRAFGVTARK
jgi:predicted methyltransferase